MNIEKRRASRRAWQRNNADRVRASHAPRRSAVNRRHALKRKYGITPEEFELLHRSQMGLCRICLDRPAHVVDHDHDTGRVRGLLCSPCNTGLGGLRDGVLFDSARMYLVPVP